MAAKKKPNFGQITKRTVKKPSNMVDFLQGDMTPPEPGTRTVPKPESAKMATEKVAAKPKSVPVSQPEPTPPNDPKPEQPAPPSEVQGAQSDELPSLIDTLTNSTTVNFNPDVMDDLEMLWFKLKRKAPTGKKKKFSKSLLINLMVAQSIKEIESAENLDHPVVAAIMQTIE